MGVIWSSSMSILILEKHLLGLVLHLQLKYPFVAYSLLIYLRVVLEILQLLQHS